MAKFSIRFNRRYAIMLGVLMVCGAAAFALVKQQGYRSVADLPLISELHVSPDPSTPYTLGMVQLDDNGAFRSSSQIRKIVDTIRTGASETGAVIVLFVHGWNATCELCSEQVKCFEQQLAFISELQKFYTPSRKVYGVYVGWRGVRLAPARYNSALTFEDRRDVADRIGSKGDLRSVIEQLGAVRRQLKRASVLIVAGHSLGGRAVFKSMTSGIGEAQRASTLSTLESFSDLLLLLNPALSASDYLSVDAEAAGRAKARQGEFDAGEAPKMLVLGSESDYVTQYVYPFSVDRWWPFQLAKDADLEKFTTVGNFSPFYTHRLVLADGHVASRPAEPVRDDRVTTRCDCGTIGPDVYRSLVDTRKNARASDRNRLYDFNNIEMPGGVDGSKYHVKLISMGVDRGPYFVVQVDRRLMNGHSGYYTPAIAEFLTRVANQRFFRAASSGRNNAVPR